MADSEGGQQKKRVSIVAPPAGGGGRTKALPRRSMGPRQMSLKPFTPDFHGSSDEDDITQHDDDAKTRPGAGWSNGDLPPQLTPATTLHPFTRSGRLALYNHHRRWINFKSSWSRIGEGHTEISGGGAVGESAGGESLLKAGDLEEEGRTVRALVAQLCEYFFKAGWATGTGGGASVRVGGPSENRPYRVFVAPSGLQKEDIVGDDIFEMDMEQNITTPSKTPNLRLSACTPLWFVVYRLRPKARCVIHTHSINALMATLLDTTERSPALQVTHLEMLKGVGNHAYDDVLEIPIIDNRPTEDLLADQLEEALKNYPKSNAVLVRRHGLYVWGDSWEQAKAQCESFDYLFECAVKMKSMGLDSALKPVSVNYYAESKGKNRTIDMIMNGAEEEKKEDCSPPAKKIKSDVPAAVAPAFNASAAADNAKDLECGPTDVPLVPRDSKVLLLDIEGTTTSISFVKDTLFPYVLRNLEKFLHSDAMSADDLTNLDAALKGDLEKLPADHPSVVDWRAKIGGGVGDVRLSIGIAVRALMDHDVKATGLKSFQGKMWKDGYATGELVAHLYPDFVPMLDWCKSNGVRVCIYSSGSVGAQKLLFGHTEQGDLTGKLDGYFDTTSGSKRESASYVTIAGKLGVEPGAVVFVTDLEAEAVMAREGGMKAVLAARPGNAPLREEMKRDYPVVRSLMQLCG